MILFIYFIIKKLEYNSILIKILKNDQEIKVFFYFLIPTLQDYFVFLYKIKITFKIIYNYFLLKIDFF